MLQKLIVANWKMNGDLLQIRALLKEFCLQTEPTVSGTLAVVICPPTLYASYVLGRLAELGWEMGGQDCSAKANGAFTGDISASMLKDIGCQYVIIGHSERRQYHQENNALIQQKMERAFEAALIPILCVGETADDRQQGKTLSVIDQQLSEGLTQSAASHPFAVAYEPVWAIGTGNIPQSEDIQTVHTHIKQLLAQKNLQPQSIPVLYGGSVNGQNSSEIVAIPNVDGVLVGGASLKAADFLKIIKSYDR